MTPRDFTAALVNTLERIGWEYMVVGSVASSAYGEGRTTQDIDIVARFRQTDVDAMLGDFREPDYYVSREAALDAALRGGMFNIIHIPSGFKAAIVKARAGVYEDTQFSRARRLRMLPDLTASTASPEDIILAKLMFYDSGSSDKHLRDIAGILRVQGGAIDRAYIALWAERLDVTSHWLAVAARADGP